METISITQLLRRFTDDGLCIEWLENVRWLDTPVCPHCGGSENISQPASKPHTYWHGDCRANFSLTTKTVLHNTKTSAQNWVVAIYSVLTAAKGISALQLSKELGVQQRTAWYMLQRIRVACEAGDFVLSEAGDGPAVAADIEAVLRQILRPTGSLPEATHRAPTGADLYRPYRLEERSLFWPIPQQASA